MVIGVNYWYAMPQNYFIERDQPLMNDANIHYIRLGAVNFANLNQYDATVNYLVANNIDVLGILQAEDCLDNITAWGTYVSYMVNHFKGRISAWEVWNEPNWEGFYQNASGYTAFLKIAYTNAKNIYPNCIIVSGGILSDLSGVSYLTEMYQSGVSGYMDVIGLHPYVDGVSPEEPNRDSSGHSFWELPNVLQVMTAYGDGEKSIWITEFGYNTPGENDYAGDGLTVTEQQQSEYLISALSMSESWGCVERFYIYQWMDAGGEWQQFGLIRGNWNAPYQVKPSYNAVKSFIVNIG